MSIYEEAEKYDVILIAPQIGYMLKRLKESITEKPVLQIPTSVFASYDALAALKFIQSELEIFRQEKVMSKRMNVPIVQNMKIVSYQLLF